MEATQKEHVARTENTLDVHSLHNVGRKILLNEVTWKT